MKFYNTLTKKVDDFVPIHENIVNMYTCGPTVYHYAHIGNMRNYIGHDILEKTLLYLGYNVKRAMNITDVGHLTSDADTGEDKMEVASKREGKSAYEIADFYTKAFFKDFNNLNCKMPEIVSKATDNIDMYIKIIEDLLKKDIWPGVWRRPWRKGGFWASSPAGSPPPPAASPQPWCSAS